MKETTTKKTITKQGKDLKQSVQTGLKSAMTAPKKIQSKESHIPKNLTHRYTELPSLRYGATPTQINYQARESGPLRVSIYNENSYSRKTTGKLNVNASTPFGGHSNCTGNSLGSVVVDAPPVRRVHFAELPPKSSSFVDFSEFKEKIADGREEKEETENCMRNRGAGIPFAGGNLVSSSSRTGRHGFPSSASNFSSSFKITGFKLGNNAVLNKSTVFANSSLKQVIRSLETVKNRHGILNLSSAAQVPAILRAAKDGDDEKLAEILRKASSFGISADELNAVDSSGRTPLSHIASNGTLANLKTILQLPKIDVNKPDNEGNTPLHFASQAGQVEVINYMLSVCTNLNIDARNALGFTPLMKAALQGRTKCAKLLLFAGASPTLKDSGRGFRAEEWAKFCGRYGCAEVIEKFTRNKLLDRSSVHGKWGSEPELAEKSNALKPSPIIPSPSSSGIKSKLRKAFRTISHPGSDLNVKPYSVVSHLTSAALCASSPVLQSSVSPSVKSLMRPLSVPKLQVTLANNSTYNDDPELVLQHSSKETSIKEKSNSARLPNRIKKK